MLDPKVFKAYDVRGVYPGEVHEDGARAIGAAFAAYLKARRIAVGRYLTFVFENRDTMRFQVQEMARAERMMRDEQIEREIETYNALIPEPGELSDGQHDGVIQRPDATRGSRGFSVTGGQYRERR